MKVEIFSDVVCPWCAVGKRRFEHALEQFSHREQLDVLWRAFELDPEAPAVSNDDIASHIATKYGITRDQALASQAKLTATPAEEGLDFHFELTKRSNTFDAHRLLHFAREVGLQGALKERLLQAYFTEGEAIGDRSTLLRIAEQVGLDKEEIAEVLESGRYGDQVRADEREARGLGISGVPFFIIDRQIGISGAQSSEVILQALKGAWTASHPLVVIADNGTACVDGSCEIGITASSTSDTNRLD